MAAAVVACEERRGGDGGEGNRGGEVVVVDFGSLAGAMDFHRELRNLRCPRGHI